MRFRGGGGSSFFQGAPILRSPCRVRLRKAFTGTRLTASRGPGCSALSERELAISVRRRRFATLAELGVAAAVAHDPADLLPLDIAVDAGHPQVDLGEQQALAGRNHVVGPDNGTRRGGLAPSQATVARQAHNPGPPIPAQFAVA